MTACLTTLQLKHGIRLCTSIQHLDVMCAVSLSACNLLHDDRCDLARAIEKWGGPSHLAEDLAYGVPQRGARQTAAKELKASLSDTAQHDQASALCSVDYDCDELSATKISTKSARARSIAATSKANSNTHSNQSKQQPDRQHSRPQIASPFDVQAREKQPIVNNRRRVAIRRKSPKLPTMRQEIDNW